MFWKADWRSLRSLVVGGGRKEDEEEGTLRESRHEQSQRRNLVQGVKEKEVRQLR